MKQMIKQTAHFNFMNLPETIQVYNEETVYNKRGKPPCIRIAKSRIEFSCEAVKLLGLKKEDKISFYTDLKDKEIIFFGKSKNGLSLRQAAELKSGVRLQVCCRPLVIKLLSHLGLNNNKTFRISNETTDFYGEKLWFILKDKVHRPIQWRKKT